MNVKENLNYVGLWVGLLCVHKNKTNYKIGVDYYFKGGSPISFKV